MDQLGRCRIRMALENARTIYRVAMIVTNLRVNVFHTLCQMVRGLDAYTTYQDATPSQFGHIM